VLGEFFSIHLIAVLSSVDGAGIFFEFFRFNLFPEYWILARLILQTTWLLSISLSALFIVEAKMSQHFTSIQRQELVSLIGLPLMVTSELGLPMLILVVHSCAYVNSHSEIKRLPSSNWGQIHESLMQTDRYIDTATKYVSRYYLTPLVLTLVLFLSFSGWLHTQSRGSSPVWRVPLVKWLWHWKSQDHLRLRPPC